ncbi:hypothetical protein JMUB5695_01438 [Mycobacterium heckeshornense]|uniref:hypothetical protein n=1 Tax=Mycobacterium heckeshornense TaxID=110505 RepID=UPI001941443C|nr:hypothetical protein [Mycobacterium heckeshornense]BCQ08013.1 hypothetical protein JMUB5695_01438 [Mycobacterium heckeshornense]
MQPRPLTNARARGAWLHRGDPNESIRHRIVALAADTHELVVSVGGLLCDRAMAGWDVLVYLQRPSDDVALRVLGVAAAELKTDPLGAVGLDWPNVVLVSAQLYAGQRWIRKQLMAAHHSSDLDVAIWGPKTEQREFGKDMHPVEFRISHAARAFKTVALRMSGELTRPAALTERLLCTQNTCLV